MSEFITGWNANKLRAEIAGRVAVNMNTACEFVVDRAKALAPVRTGLLRDNIIHEIHAKGDVVEGLVGARTKGAHPRPWYALFVETGTKQRPARPFLRPAVFNHGAEIVRILQEGR